MKQKMVIKVNMNCQKCRSKAMKIAAGLSGLESVSLKGDDKGQIEVTGDGVDPVQLTSLLRKSLRHAELVSVIVEGGEKKEEKQEKKKKKEKEKPQANVWTPYNQPCYVYEVPLYGCAQHYDPFCSIL